MTFFFHLVIFLYIHNMKKILLIIVSLLILSSCSTVYDIKGKYTVDDIMTLHKLVKLKKDTLVFTWSHKVYIKTDDTTFKIGKWYYHDDYAYISSYGKIIRFQPYCDHGIKLLFDKCIYSKEYKNVHGVLQPL